MPTPETTSVIAAASVSTMVSMFAICAITVRTCVMVKAVYDELGRWRLRMTSRILREAGITSPVCAMEKKISFTMSVPVK